MPPSPSLGPPLLSASWSPPLFWGMPLLEAGLVFLGAGFAFLGAGFAEGLTLVELGWLAPVLGLLPPPQPATTSATSGIAAVAKKVMRVLRIMLAPWSWEVGSMVAAQAAVVVGPRAALSATASAVGEPACPSSAPSPAGRSRRRELAGARSGLSPGRVRGRCS